MLSESESDDEEVFLEHANNGRSKRNVIPNGVAVTTTNSGKKNGFARRLPTKKNSENEDSNLSDTPNDIITKA